MRTTLYWLFLTVFILGIDIAAGEMTPDLMVARIKKVGKDVKRKGNVVNFTYNQVPIILVFDTNADRMRLISPIIKVEDLKKDMLLKAMEANFHSALDARYCISNGVVWAAFIHPLSDLSDKLLESAIKQVATARITFGDGYSSGNLVFGGGSEKKEKKEILGPEAAVK